MKMEFSAGGIVFKKKNDQFYFLSVLNSENIWTFPKGHIEKREKPEAAAKREVSEETGISEVDSIKKIDKIDYWFKSEGELIHKFVYYFLMHSNQQQIAYQKNELKDAKWMNQDKLAKKLIYQTDKKIMKMALNLLNLDK